MKISLLAAFLCSHVFVVAQQPKPAKYFIADDDQWCINYITLGSDSTFFWSGSCESGTVAVSKGKWTKNGRWLVLKGFDSISSYPKATVTFQKGHGTDEVVIRVKDYFGDPFRYLSYGLIRTGDSSLKNPAYFYADSLGELRVSKKEFEGFYLIYQFHSPHFPLPDPVHSYRFDDADIINIHIDFASSAGLDRGILLRNFGTITYKEKKGGLYLNGKKIYRVDDP